MKSKELHGAFGERTVRLVRDEAISNIVESILLHFFEHALRNGNAEVAQDVAVIIQVLSERIPLVKVGVELVVVFYKLRLVKKFNGLEDDHEEIT